MQVSKDEALRVLERAVDQAQSTSPPKHDPWLADIEEICKNSEAVDIGTHIAALGTIFLAKATNLEANVLTLKSGGSDPGAYSARNLCKDVLAAHAPRLNLDLGVNGREPLNNQPYNGKSTLYEAHDSARENAKPIAARVIALAETLQAGISYEEAFAALVTYCRLRHGRRQREDLELESYTFNLTQLYEWIEDFTKSNGEGGRVAQAIAAGILDALHGEHYEVRADRINDPDRKFPGDVALFDEEQDLPFRTMEVRDKPVKETDLFHLINKCQEAHVLRVAMLAVSNKQTLFDMSESQARAIEENITLKVHLSWFEMLSAELLHSATNLEHFNDRFAESIYQWLQKLEVSEARCRQWRDLTTSKPALT